MGKVKEYSNGELTVVWKPEKCIHAGVCVKMLPNVYHPNDKPWITLGDTANEDLKKQISSCPSGALSYYMNGEEDQEKSSLDTKVEVLENGPLLVYGTLHLVDSKGKKTLENKTTAFCRCGQSSNKPYCDGSHVKADFKG